MNWSKYFTDEYGINTPPGFDDPSIEFTITNHSINHHMPDDKLTIELERTVPPPKDGRKFEKWVTPPIKAFRDDTDEDSDSREGRKWDNVHDGDA